ncbi:MAG: hypothetical protein JWN20_280 [Jatrophihabitantaceae bacterium]|nr:hypothetical protein [Jatrophihabitantaceae bacterium]
MVDAVVSRAPIDANRDAPGSIGYEGPHGPLHGHVGPGSTVVHGSVMGEVQVPWGAEGSRDALALRLVEGMVVTVGDPGAALQAARAYRSRAGRSRAARAVTLHSGPQVWLWRATGAPLSRRAVLERADGAVVARVSGRGALSVASSATALEVALAVASVLSGLSAAASGHSTI